MDAPDTPLSKPKAPYYYADTLLSGFRASYWFSGSCTQDYGSVTSMPITGRLTTSAKAYATGYSHRRETLTPAQVVGKKCQLDALSQQPQEYCTFGSIFFPFWALALSYA
jgi:hypothetical protein